VSRTYAPTAINRRSYFQIFRSLANTSIISPGLRGSRSLPLVSASIDAGVNVTFFGIADSLVGSPCDKKHVKNRVKSGVKPGPTESNPVGMGDVHLDHSSSSFSAP
jgi:hypothetical protein